jgi:hypothetical protein
VISVIDEALARLAPYGPELANGNTNHAPMAAEALCAMGRADAVLPWIERYRRSLVPRAAATARIDAAEWRRSLGRAELVAEWTAFFENELAEAPSADVVARWTARLAPGFSAAAMHGILRTAHAVRSLADRESPQRLRELAEGLGYWASTYEEIPGARSGDRRLAPRDAMARVPIVPPERRRFAGSITSSLAVLAEVPEFGAVLDAVDVSGPPAATISRLTETFARTSLANTHDVLTAIVFIHGVTGTTAIRALLPYLDDDTARGLVRYAWQAGAALYATFARRPFAVEPIDPPRESADALVHLAVDHGDEHAIKFTEACLREHRLAPSPAYLAAARYVLDVLPRPA